MNCDPERKHDKRCLCILIKEEVWEMFFWGEKKKKANKKPVKSQLNMHLKKENANKLIGYIPKEYLREQ